jgi:hypothetical protein
MKTLSLLFCLFVCAWCGFGGPLSLSHSQGKFSDAEVEATIRAKLAKSKIGKDGVQVHVKDGVATWTGSTTVMQHKGAATRMAKAAGAIHVLNNIKVAGESGLPVKGNLPGQPRHAVVKTSEKTAGNDAP